jgi:Flp pilus assembly protein TadD
MKIAVLPFNVDEKTRPALGRQFANFSADSVRAATEADVNSVNFLAQLSGEEEGRAAFVNLADTLFEQQWIEQFFSEAQADRVMDGLLKEDDGAFDLTVRFHDRGGSEPVAVKEFKFTKADLFKVLHDLVKDLAAQAGASLPAELAASMDFGTENPDAFLKFLEGYDALMYINQTQGAVATQFSPMGAMQALLDAVDLDKDFLGPYETCVQLCRACVHYRLGTFEAVEAALNKLMETAPDDFRAYFALAEAYQAVNNHAKAADIFEKAGQLEPNEPGIWARLGMAQMALGMPVNAERNFKRAYELEQGPERPSLELLTGVLQQTGRAHEAPPLWKAMAEEYPDSANVQAKLAMALLAAGQEEEAINTFENSLDKVSDPTLVKRFYAPVLAQKGDHDRAMDFYEDCLDVAPNDIQLLLEYAQTLQAAGREFEVPKVLRDVLASNPDPNTRAQTLAWMIELEQPNRVKVVEAAQEKMNEGDFESAARDLKPLRNWLADYWKLWALLCSAHNRLEQYAEAEEASKRLLDLFPGCEPGYGELVNALTSQGKQEEAYNAMRYAAAQMPQSLSVHVNLALAARRAGHTDEARALAKQIREAVGPNQELEPVLAEIER